MSHIFRSRHTVIGKLHNKGHSFSLKCCFLEYQRHDNSHNNPKHIQANHNQRFILWKEGSREKSINGKFCRTTHKRCQQNGHLSVPLGRKSPAGHNARYSTSESNEHGNNTSAGKPQLTQQFIHNKGHPCHITAVLQNRQKEKQGHNNRQEAEHTAHTVENTVNYKGMYHTVHMSCCHSLIRQLSQGCDSIFQKALQKCTNDIKSKPEHNSHNANKSRDSCIFSGEEMVHFPASDTLLAFLGLDDGSAAHILNVAKPHLRHSSRAIHTCFYFRLSGNIFQKIFLLLGKMQLFQQLTVSLHYLTGRKPDGNTCLSGMVLNQVHDGMNSPVNPFFFAAKIHLQRLFLVFRHMNGMAD